MMSEFVAMPAGASGVALAAPKPASVATMKAAAKIFILFLVFYPRVFGGIWLRRDGLAANSDKIVGMKASD
jgi:hypothetical protein